MWMFIRWAWPRTFAVPLSFEEVERIYSRVPTKFFWPRRLLAGCTTSERGSSHQPYRSPNSNVCWWASSLQDAQRGIAWCRSVCAVGDGTFQFRFPRTPLRIETRRRKRITIFQTQCRGRHWQSRICGFNKRKNTLGDSMLIAALHLDPGYSSAERKTNKNVTADHTSCDEDERTSR